MSNWSPYKDIGGNIEYFPSYDSAFRFAESHNARLYSNSMDIWIHCGLPAKAA